MKINSDLVWATILIGLAAASFMLGLKRGSLTAEDELQRKQEEIKILESKNEQLSEELASRGIFSYPQANIISKANDSLAVALISLNGKEPIVNLRVKKEIIYDYSDEKPMVQKLRVTDLGDLKPHNPAAFEIPLPGEEVAINLEYDSKRKKWQQFIWVKKSNDGKIKSFWIITNENSVVIDRHIDKGFPVDAKGEIILGNDREIDYSSLELNSIFQL